jgi:hypothetical protein
MDGLRSEMCGRRPSEQQRDVGDWGRVPDLVPTGDADLRRVDEGGFVSNGAILPFPVIRLTVPFS